MALFQSRKNYFVLFLFVSVAVLTVYVIDRVGYDFSGIDIEKKYEKSLRQVGIDVGLSGGGSTGEKRTSAGVESKSDREIVNSDADGHHKVANLQGEDNGESGDGKYAEFDYQPTVVYGYTSVELDLPLQGGVGISPVKQR